MRGHERPSDPTHEGDGALTGTAPDSAEAPLPGQPTGSTGSTGTAAEPAGDATPGPVPPEQDPLRHSRTSGAFVGLGVALVLLVLLIIFILQNTAKAPIHFLWFDGRVSVAVALLIAVAVGMAVTVLAGGLRILQLRRRIRQDRKQRAVR